MAGKGEHVKAHPGTSLAVRLFRLRVSTAGSTGWIPGWGTKILRGTAKKRKKESSLSWSINTKTNPVSVEFPHLPFETVIMLSLYFTDQETEVPQVGMPSHNSTPGGYAQPQQQSGRCRGHGWPGLRSWLHHLPAGHTG